MRSVWLALLLLIPTAVAWEDDADDYEIGMRAITMDQEPTIVWTEGAVTGWYPYVDLEEASISETQNDVILEIKHDATPQPQGQPQEFFWANYLFEFKLRDYDMIGVIRTSVHPDFDLGFNYFMLGTAPADGSQFWFFDQVTYFALVEEEAAGHWKVSVPKQYFRDPDYVPLREGDTLMDIKVRAFNDDFGFGTIPLIACPYAYTNPVFVSPGTCDWNARDAVSDGAILGNVEIELMPEGVGHILARSDKPWRYTNGLATTFLYEVEVHNFDDEPDTVHLAAVDVPNNWDVLHPSKVEFSGKGVETVPVAVTVPFVHKHGEELSFTLQAASEKDESAATETWLGLIFPNPAQPGGHHDTVYFHAWSENFFDPWMNTFKGLEDENDTEWNSQNPSTTPAHSLPVLPIGTTSHWEWEIDLRPSLQMGLDFELDEPLVAELDLSLGQGMATSVHGELWLVGTEEKLLVATDAEPVTFVADQQQTVVLTGMPEAVADRVPPGRHNLQWRVFITPDDSTESTVMKELNGQATLFFSGSSLQMPLIDYHEEVDLSGLQLNAFTISGNETYKEVNAGNTSVWLFNVTNKLSNQETLKWELSGSHADWAKVSPETVVPGGGAGQLVVQVTPPKGTEEGETAELLIMGTSTNDPDRQVFVRVTAYVTEDPVPDESSLAKEATSEVEAQNKALSKDSPGFNAIALIALLGAIVVMLRKRT